MVSVVKDQFNESVTQLYLYSEKTDGGKTQNDSASLGLQMPGGKPRRTREVHDSFATNQMVPIEAAQAQAMLTKVLAMTPKEQMDFVQKFLTLTSGNRTAKEGESITEEEASEFRHYGGGNIFMEMAAFMQNSMTGNQDAMVARMAKEQADQSNLSNLNQTLKSISSDVSNQAGNVKTASDNGKNDSTLTYVGLGIGILALAVFACLFTAGTAAVGLPALIGAGAVAAGGGATAATGMVKGAQDNADVSTAQSNIQADTTSAQITTNQTNITDQDLSEQNTYISQLNDTSTSMAAFTKTIAQDIQQTMNIGNMF